MKHLTNQIYKPWYKEVRKKSNTCETNKQETIFEYFPQLPLDIKLYIISYLSVSDYYNLSTTNREFNKILSEDIRKVCLLKYPEVSIDSKLVPVWMKSYEQKIYTSQRIAYIESNDCEIKIYFQNNSKKYLSIVVEGDCCAHSYYSDTHDLSQLEGKYLYNIEYNEIEGDIYNTESEDRLWVTDRYGIYLYHNTGIVTVYFITNHNGYYSGYIRVDYKDI